MNFKLLRSLFLSFWFVLYGQKPNIILIMTDDQGYGDIRAHGNTVINTPNLDELYGESVRLTNFHVDPFCAPTRSALMTGRYARRVGVRATYGGINYLHVGETTVADIFKSSGYRTGIFGKWHLGCNYPLRPIDRGFEEWVGHGDGGTGTTNDYWDNDKWDDHYWHNGKWEQYKGFITDVFFEETMKYIDNGDKRPFFVYLATNVPHQPWNTPAEWIEPYTSQGVDKINALFYASVSRVDYNLGRLRAFLSEKELADNTIVIFLTDNGTANKVSFNAGMRGRKGSIYEGGHRVPCFFHWPGRWDPAGRDVSKLTAHIDILPTLMGLAGIKPQGKLPAFDGQDISALLDGNASNIPRWSGGTPFSWDAETRSANRCRTLTAPPCIAPV